MGGQERRAKENPCRRPAGRDKRERERGAQHAAAAVHEQQQEQQRLVMGVASPSRIGSMLTGATLNGAAPSVNAAGRGAYTSSGGQCAPHRRTPMATAKRPKQSTEQDPPDGPQLDPLPRGPRGRPLARRAGRHSPRHRGHPPPPQRALPRMGCLLRQARCGAPLPAPPLRTRDRKRRQALANRHPSVYNALISPPLTPEQSSLPLQGAGGNNPDPRTKGGQCKNALRGECPTMSHFRAKRGEPPQR